MQRYRPRKSKNELMKIGSPRVSGRKNEPDPIDASGIQCPKDYTPLEAEIWNNYFMLLMATRTLSAGDAAILDIFVRAYAELMELESFLKEHGKVYETKTGRKFSRPEVAIRNDARRELRGLMIQLGLSPASRAHVTVTGRNVNRWTIK